jgi:hypothetical protein
MGVYMADNARGAVEVIPGVTEAEIDAMVDYIFHRVDGTPCEMENSSDEITRILNNGGPLADKSPAFMQKIV